MISKSLIEPIYFENKPHYMLRVDVNNLEQQGYSSYGKEPYPVILDVIEKNDGITELELREKLARDGLPISGRPLYFRKFVIELLNAGLIEFDENGRLHCIHADEWGRKRAERQKKMPEWVNAILTSSVIERS